MKQFFDLKGLKCTADFLDISLGEDSTIYMDLDALRCILPIVVAASDGGEDELLRCGVIISHITNRLQRIWDELREGAKA